MKVLRLLVWLYAAIVFMTAVSAWYFDIRFLNSGRERLLPDILLMFVTFPSSLSLGALYENFPIFFSEPFTQLTWLTMCGAAQASALFFAENLACRKRVRISKP